MTATLELEKVCKNFRSYWTFSSMRAVEDISLHVNQGETFGFLGHNGAGKTTTIKCILGLVRLTSGSIRYEGQSLSNRSLRRQIGYLPEQPYFYDHLNVEETLRFFAELCEVPSRERAARIQELLVLLHLDHRRLTPVRLLSKGLQQRLGIAQALLNRPKLLILDEPFSGLDPGGRKEIRELFHQCQREGTTIFVSSHILSDIEDLCHRVAILRQGKLVRSLALKDIPEEFGAEYLISVSDLKAVPDSLKSLATPATFPEGAGWNIRANSLSAAQTMLDQLRAAGATVLQLESHRPSLEDVFLKLSRAPEES